MSSYTSSEKAYLLHLCAIHRIVANRYAPYNAWPRVIHAMIAEAPRHLEGGDLFDDDPWPARRYTVSNTGRFCRQWLSVRRFPMRNADPGAREGGVDAERMGVGFVLNERPELPPNIEADNGTPPPPYARLPDPEPPANIEPGNGTPAPPYIRLPVPQLPSLREVLSMPNNHPQPILNMDTRLVQGRPRQPDERRRLPDGPVNRRPDAQ
ncbi:hypothetical protein EAF04_007234 [Stromatinia cepivora]|nr:hypothetical protein EAF04_007234 [Stromatinia cepivora]